MTLDDELVTLTTSPSVHYWRDTGRAYGRAVHRARRKMGLSTTRAKKSRWVWTITYYFSLTDSSGRILMF